MSESENIEKKQKKQVGIFSLFSGKKIFFFGKKIFFFGKKKFHPPH
jgi:hypothetical protein